MNKHRALQLAGTCNTVATEFQKLFHDADIDGLGKDPNSERYVTRGCEYLSLDLNPYRVREYHAKMQR